MILLVTNKRDLTMDYIVRELKKRSVDFFRLNTEDISNYLCSIGNNHFDDWSVGDISGENVKAAYFRRPGRPVSKIDSFSQEVERYVSSEWSSFLKSLYYRLDSKWLNSPSSIFAAEDKPKQLLLAKKLGFFVPDNIVTNDIGKVIKGNLIAKPLSQSLIDDGQEKVIFTNRIDEIDNEFKESLAYSPVIFQQEIKKKYDIRVTVVGKNVFATAIHSQENYETSVDWRKGGNVNLIHESINIPLDIESLCIEMVKVLNLKFGAIDLICDREGKYWFLEINPNGQWAWIENRTNVPISERIVDELLCIGAEA